MIIDKITPYDLWGEIVEKQNVALALVVAAMSLGLIVAAASTELNPACTRLCKLHRAGGPAAN
jgi:uncharacterized membrane protein YjfL (UPF0719 family)